MDDQIDTDQLELIDEVNNKNINGNKFQNHTNKGIKSIMGATNKVIINDEITLNPTTEGTLEEITADSEISQEDVQLNLDLGNDVDALLDAIIAGEALDSVSLSLLTPEIANQVYNQLESSLKFLMPD